jgi:hypothetical protein
MNRSEEVLKLVTIVGRLPREDQTRILKIVDLLSMASTQVQHRTQRMLGELLEGGLESKAACVAGIDEVIAYLEQAVYDDEGSWSRFDEATMVGNA